jgi:hypothetical protein
MCPIGQPAGPKIENPLRFGETAIPRLPKVSKQPLRPVSQFNDVRRSCGITRSLGLASYQPMPAALKARCAQPSLPAVSGSNVGGVVEQAVFFLLLG